MAKTSIVRTCGVRDSTEDELIKNYAAEYAKRLFEKEAEERKKADEALKLEITTHANETATDKKSSHVFLSDEVDSDKNAASGKTAATPRAVKTVNDALKEEVKTRETQVKALDNRLKQEISDRQAGDTRLDKRIDAEITDRGVADDALRERINAEAEERKTADAQLGKRIDDEAAARGAADDALDTRLKKVEEMAHTHENKDILDSITGDRVNAWDTIADGTVTLGEYLEHLAEAGQQFQMLWKLFGMNVYDGGWFGMAQLDMPLDGGSFDSAYLSPLDCGDFGEYSIPIGELGTVIDGGNY